MSICPRQTLVWRSLLVIYKEHVGRVFVLLIWSCWGFSLISRLSLLQTQQVNEVLLSASLFIASALQQQHFNSERLGVQTLRMICPCNNLKLSKDKNQTEWYITCFFLSFFIGMATLKNGFTIFALALITFFILEKPNVNKVPSAGSLVGPLYLQETWDVHMIRGFDKQPFTGLCCLFQEHEEFLPHTRHRREGWWNY